MPEQPEPDADDPEDDQPEQADAMAKDDDMRASDVVKIVQAMAASREPAQPQQMQIIQRMEVGADSAKILGEAIAANMPQHAAPVVNVAAPSVTVEAARVEIPPALVTVNVPQQAAPVVMAAAQPAPVIHVHVPEAKRRKQIARETPDGVIIEDVDP
jgi:hypothetical protein